MRSTPQILTENVLHCQFRNYFSASIDINFKPLRTARIVIDN